MKSALYSRIIKLAIAEIMIQIGFENASEQSLNACTELFTFFMESMIGRLIPFKNVSSDTQLKRILADFISEEEYQFPELLQFIEQQAVAKRHIKEKTESEGETNLLSMLRILPKDVNLKSGFRNTKNLALEQKHAPAVYEEVPIDSYLNIFIEHCQSLAALKNTVETSEKIPNPIENVCENTEEFKFFGDISFQEDLIEMGPHDYESCLNGISNLKCRSRVFKSL